MRTFLIASVLALTACKRAPERVASSEPIPGRFGIGRAATPDDIRRMDIDVGPDGVGLPPGGATAAAGAPVYAAKCANCHGPSGEGTAVAMKLVGRNPNDTFDFASERKKEGTKTVGNYWPYATTLYDYVRRAMPFDKPGSLTSDEVYGVVAFILARNGVVKDDTRIDASTLTAVRMPARDRFVTDDRMQSTRVR